MSASDTEVDSTPVTVPVTTEVPPATTAAAVSSASDADSTCTVWKLAINCDEAILDVPARNRTRHGSHHGTRTLATPTCQACLLARNHKSTHGFCSMKCSVALDVTLTGQQQSNGTETATEIALGSTSLTWQPLNHPWAMCQTLKFDPPRVQRRSRITNLVVSGAWKTPTGADAENACDPIPTVELPQVKIISPALLRMLQSNRTRPLRPRRHHIDHRLPNVTSEEGAAGAPAAADTAASETGTMNPTPTSYGRSKQRLQSAQPSKESSADSSEQHEFHVQAVTSTHVGEPVTHEPHIFAALTPAPAGTTPIERRSIYICAHPVSCDKH